MFYKILAMWCNFHVLLWIFHLCGFGMPYLSFVKIVFKMYVRSNMNVFWQGGNIQSTFLQD